MQLLSDIQLEQSAVVANCRMNRERTLTGSNGYVKELGINPLDLLGQTLRTAERASWLDLCCGSGQALIEAAEALRAEGLVDRVTIVGVDLVGMFKPTPNGLDSLQLARASLTDWRPDREFDLISCVHGLHYIGDKLGLIARAASWLTEDGQFVASLDLANIKFTDGGSASRAGANEFRRNGLLYDARKKLVSCRGRCRVDFSWRYLGANDQAGKNYTGQEAVDSYYAPLDATQPSA